MIPPKRAAEGACSMVHLGSDAMVLLWLHFEFNAIKTKCALCTCLRLLLAIPVQPCTRTCSRALPKKKCLYNIILPKRKQKEKKEIAKENKKTNRIQIGILLAACKTSFLPLK